MEILFTCGPTTDRRGIRAVRPTGASIMKLRSNGEVIGRRPQAASRLPLAPNITLNFNWGTTANLMQTAQERNAEFRNVWHRFNPPRAITDVINKRLTFRNAPVGSMPEHWESWSALLATGSIPVNGVVLRHLVESSRGRGIEVLRSAAEIEAAVRANTSPRLITEYHPHRSEYRCHFFKFPVGDDCDYQLLWSRKRRRRDASVNYEVRNHAGGWVYTYEGTQMSPSRQHIMETSAKYWLSGFQGLTYGALDMMFVEETRRAYVLECNSAPALTDSRTQAFYRNGFREIVERFMF